ncbi:hypothetical protein SeLEV6574_g04860 [Synchytrium endobioticum]|uniref:Uncharacterized protein n=1 Tax=Synchytrium endobioticum TaxID=286115 RepID=A0A507CX90_9FUNG|nr:hypothetical protein SeLEV6574_g04860 [Synchytrium endobioticum]
MKPNMMKKVIAIVVLQMAILYYLVSAGACCSGGHGQNPADLAVRVTTPNQDNLARDRDTQNLAVLQTQHVCKLECLNQLKPWIDVREEADALNRADAILAGEPAPIVVHEKRERPRLTEVLKNLAGASDPRRETDALSRTVRVSNV